MAAPVITSPRNETLKLVRKLHSRRWRDKLGLFVAEVVQVRLLAVTDVEQIAEHLDRIPLLPVGTEERGDR